MNDDEFEKFLFLELAKNGDENARNILIEYYFELVTNIVKKYENVAIDEDDLISIGTIGLIKAIDSFDFNKNKNFTYYVMKCVEKEILFTFISDKKINASLSLQEPVEVDEDGTVTLLRDIIECNSIEEVESKMQIDNLYRIMEEHLNNSEKTIVNLRYGLDNGYCRTYTEIARLLGKNYSYVYRTEKKAFKKLRFAFNVFDTKYKINKMSKKLFGFIKSKNMEPCFLVPIFCNIADNNKNNQYFIQNFDDENEVIQFVSYNIPKHTEIIRATGNYVVEEKSKAIYGFQFFDGKIIWGTKENLSKLLKKSKQKISSNVYIYLEVLLFISENAIEIQDTLFKIKNEMARFDETAANEWFKLHEKYFCSNVK